MSTSNKIALAHQLPKAEPVEETCEPSEVPLVEKSGVQSPAKNALIHGMYAEELILPWESADELTKLRNDIWDEPQPEGRAEEETTIGIVRLLWLKRRMMRTSQLGFCRDPFSVETSRANPKDWDGLVALIDAAVDEKASLTTAAKESLDSLKLAIERISEINTVCLPGHSQDGPPKEAFQAAQQAREDADLVLKIL